MSEKARKILAATEAETRAEILREFLALQVRLKARFRDLLAAIEDQRKLTGSVPVSFLYERSRMATLLVDVANEINLMTPNVTASIIKAQRKATGISDLDFDHFIQTQSNAGQIVRFNPEATKQLIGNTQIKTPLQDLLNGLSEPLTLAVKKALIDGVANGSGANKIAAEINLALGTGTAHALTIARTEMNQAFRQANLIHYQSNSDIVKGYVWLSALDLRTCLICWSRHGVIYELNKKPTSHPNCRCTMSPYIPGTTKPVETGEESFRKLTPQQKKAIIGEKRFALYDEENLRLSDFVGERKTIYGQTPYIKNLSEISPKSKKTNPNKKVTPKPTQKTPNIPSNTSKPLSAKQAARKLKAIHKKYGNKQVTLTNDLLQAKEELLNVFDTKFLSKLASERGIDVSTQDKLLKFQIAYKNEVLPKIAKLEIELDGLNDKFRAEAFAVVKVEKPANVKAIFKSKFTATEQASIQAGIDDFNSLVDGQFLKNETFNYVKDRSNRSFYSRKTIHLSQRARTSAGRSTVVHETAHGLEMLEPTILDQALEFWEYRTKGESLVKLSKATGIRNYGNRELCKVDQFKDPYDGKQPYMLKGKPIATEIITRGMEYLWSNPATFAVEQPEYFDFMYKVLRGQKWQPK